MPLETLSFCSCRGGFHRQTGNIESGKAASIVIVGMEFNTLLSGGNPRVLKNVDLAVRQVQNDHSKLRGLFDCLYSGDEIVRMRAADALEKICRLNPRLITPYMDELLTKVAANPQPSIQWHIAQIIGQVDLNQKQHDAAIMFLKEKLQHATDWIVLGYSLESFAKFAQKDASQQKYFKRQLKKLTASKYKSVSKRAARLLERF